MQIAQRRILWLQAFTIVWMTIEVGVALSAAATAHSPALFAFGSDSVVELLSGLTVLLPWMTNSVPHQVADRASGFLLILLAVIVLGGFAVQWWQTSAVAQKLAPAAPKPAPAAAAAA